MKKQIVAGLLAVTTFAAYAQQSNQENITISRNGKTNEKITVVIDGDKVTINGKPVEEFKGANVQVIRNQNRSITAPRMAKGVRVAAPTIGKTNKALLGVSTTKVAETDGVEITAVTAGGAADKAGLKEGDIITQLGSTNINNPDDLYKAVGSYKPDDKVEITYSRNSKIATTTAILGANNTRAITINREGDFDFDFDFDMPELRELQVIPSEEIVVNGFQWGKPRLGLQVQDLEEGNGVKVISTTENGAAATAGLQPGDIITEINGNSITDVTTLKEATQNAKEGDSLAITYTRNGKIAKTTAKFPKKLKKASL
jgi:serine protease Do